MSEGFRGPELKLRRAEDHIIELRSLIGKFLNLQSYKAVADLEAQPGKVAWFARGEDVFPHDEFSPIIGDAIHNLRDALDLAISVIARNAGLSDKNIQFPTGDSMEHFRDGKAMKRLRKNRLPKKLLDTLAFEIQPHQGGNGHLLNDLHKMAIADKHRLIVATVLGMVEMEMSNEKLNFGMLLVEPRPISDGCLLFSPSVKDYPEVRHGEEAKVKLTVSFGRDSGYLRGDPVEEGCRQLMYAVERTLDALRVCL